MFSTHKVYNDTEKNLRKYLLHIFENSDIMGEVKEC